MQAEHLLSVGAELGEGPVWIDGALWFVDIKRNTVFRLEVPLNERQRLALDLHGNQLRYALPVRATRKFKARKTVEL